MDDVSEMRQNRIPAVIAVIVVSVLTLFQGGYYSDYACWTGVVSLIACVILLLFLPGARRDTRIPWYAVLLVLLGFCALASAVLNGATMSSLSEASMWFAVAGFALLCALIPNIDRSFLYRVLGWAGVITAILALLMFANVIPYEGSVNTGRLQYSFQYANTAALWFSIVFIVAALSDDKRLRIAAFFPLLALLFSQSMGTLAVFALAVLAISILWYRKQQIGRICAFFMQLICAIVGAALVIAVVGTAVSGVAALVVLLSFALLMGLRRFVGPVLETWFCDHTRASLGLIIISFVLIGLLVLVFGFTGRLFQASQTFIERLVQMNDALALLGTAPFLGIGPDGWAGAYQGIQSAQYVATVVHNGYLQIALDAGCLGLIVFLALLVVGLRAAIKAADFVSIIAVSLIAIHAFFDFDFSFASILMVLVLLLPHSEHQTVKRQIKTAVFVVLSVLITAGCMGGLWCWQQKNEVAIYLNEGNLSEAESKITAQTALEADREIRTLWLSALCNFGEQDKAIKIYQSWDYPSAEQSIIAAASAYSLGEQTAAEEILLAQMESQPKNTELYEAAQTLFDRYGLSDEAKERYKRALDNVNAPVVGVGSLLQNQKQF